MKALGPLQIEHFAKMTPQERNEAIRDFEHQLGHISFSMNKSADDKREELLARIDHLMKLNRKAGV